MSASNHNPTGAGQPIPSVTTADPGATSSTPSSDPLFVQGTPMPAGMVPQPGHGDPMAGTGVEGEEVVWAARYSLWNFAGAIALRLVLTIGVIALAVIASQSPEYDYLPKLNYLAAAIVGFMWLYLAVRMIQAWYGRYYRLTTRRLFVSTGIIRRRRDMLELLRVNDVTMRQNSLLDRWIGLGTVIVISSEKNLPNYTLLGVRDPKKVLDLIWHHARTERDLRSVKVDHV